jgi:hypothetical protein
MENHVLPFPYKDDEYHETPSHFSNMKAPDSSQDFEEKSLYNPSDNSDVSNEE